MGGSHGGRLVHAPVLTRWQLDGVLVCAARGDAPPVQLAGTAVDVWAAFEHPRTLEEAADLLAEAYAAAPDQVLADLRTAVVQLVEHGLLQPAV